MNELDFRKRTRSFFLSFAKNIELTSKRVQSRINLGLSPGISPRPSNTGVIFTLNFTLALNWDEIIKLLIAILSWIANLQMLNFWIVYLT